MKKIIIVGAGGHARSCLDLINCSKQFKFAGFVDNFSSNKMVIGKDRDLKKIFKKVKFALIGLGQIRSNSKRLKLFRMLKKIGYKLPVIKSPNAYVSNLAKIDEGTVVMHRAIINSYAKIGKNVIINTGAIIEHDTVIKDNSHISTNVTINGECIIEKNTFIGSNSVVVNNVRVGKSKFIKANSLVKKNK